MGSIIYLYVLRYHFYLSKKKKAEMKLLFCIFLIFCQQLGTFGQTETTTEIDQPCWSEAFPNMTAIIKARAAERNELTCDICTEIMQGLDDFLLDNEDQIAHALENLCEGFPWLFEICWRLVEACFDDLIEIIIEYGLNPKDMCEALFLCP